MFIPRQEYINDYLTVDEVMYTTLFTAGLLQFFSHVLCSDTKMISSLQIDTNGKPTQYYTLLKQTSLITWQKTKLVSYRIIPFVINSMYRYVVIYLM